MAPKRAGLGSLAVRLPPQGFALTRWREMFRIPAGSICFLHHADDGTVHTCNPVLYRRGGCQLGGWEGGLSLLCTHLRVRTAPATHHPAEPCCRGHQPGTAALTPSSPLSSPY